MSVSEKEKRTKSLQKKLRTKIFFVGIVVAALVVIIAASSLAWFSYVNNSSISQLGLTVQDAKTILVAETTDDNWTSSLGIQAFLLKPICGNGISFFKPNLEKVKTYEDDNVRIYSYQIKSAVNFPSGEALNDYALVKEFKLKTSVPGTDLYISEESFLSASLVDSEGSCLNSSALSTAHAAGATRVAIYIKENDNYNLVCVWIPNINAHLEYIDNLPVVSSANFSVDYSVHSDGIVTYYDTYDSGIPGSTHDYENNIKLVNNAGLLNTASNYTAITLTDTVYDTGYYENNGVLYVWDLEKAFSDGKAIYNAINTSDIFYFKLVAWLDGTDRECDNALAGGKMNILLKFKQGEE